MIDIPEPESLPPHPLLAASPPRTEERLREAVFAKTARVLRRRRLVRRLAHAAALAACFVAGVLTAEWLRPAAPPREREIVILLHEGVDRHTIARQLHISEATPKTHIKNIARKHEDVQCSQKVLVYQRRLKGP